MADQQLGRSRRARRPTTRRFVALHWLLALLIAAAFVMGLVMVELRFSPLRLRLYNWHKWLGIAILGALARAPRLASRDAPPRAAALGYALVATRRGARNSLRVLRSVPDRALERMALHLRGGRSSGLARLAAAAGPDAPEQAVRRRSAETAAQRLFVPARRARGRPCGRGAQSTNSSIATACSPTCGRGGRGAGQREARSLQLRSAWLALAVASAAAQAQPAAPVRLVAAQSEITFQVKQSGVPIDGRFRNFDAQIALDPKAPQSGNVMLSIDTASATVGFAESDAELPRTAWFSARSSRARCSSRAPSRASARGASRSRAS